MRGCMLGIAGGLIALAAGRPLGAQSAGEVVTVDPARTYQTMTGWEVTSKSWEDDKVNDRYDPTSYQHMDACLDVLVNRLGINRLRLEVRSGTENPTDSWMPFVNGQLTYTQRKALRYEKINDNADPAVAAPAGFRWEEFDWRVERIAIPMINLLAARGERLYINLCYVDFGTGNQGTLSHAANPAEYAELIAETCKHLKSKYNLAPDSVEIVLEPDNSVGWGGVEVGRAIDATVPRLNANGTFPGAVVAPSTMSAAAASTYFDQMLASVPTAIPKLTVLSYHRYDGPSPATLQAIASRAQAHGLQTAMSEKLDADIATLTEDLKLVNASFWQQWAIATKNVADTGNYYLVADLSGGTPVVNLTSRSHLLQQYFRYIRLNAVRVDAASTNGGTFDPVAFRNADGRHVVVVKNASSAPFSVRGLPAGTYGITYSSPGVAQQSLPDVTIGAGGTISARGGGSGAVTIYGKTLSTNPGSLQFSAPGASVGEGGGTATLTVTRTGGSAGPVSVSYATSNGGASAGSDYSARTGTLSWADGDAAAKTFTIPIADDAAVEGDETLTATLSGPTGGATPGSPGTTTLTIVDNDVPSAGSLQFGAASPSVNEGAGTATITVTRTGGSAGAVSVSYAAANGSAAAGSDYSVASGTLSWAAGDTASKSFSITILNDAAVEGAETVLLSLNGATGGAALGLPGSAALTIVDDDSPTAAPTGLTVLAGNGRVTLVWNSVAGATSYNVYRAATPGVNKGSYASMAGGSRQSGAPRPCVQTGLSNGTTYFFVVTAVGASGEGAESAEVSATPSASGWPMPDGDLDGYGDAAEGASGSNPGDAASRPVDADLDGMADAWETARFGGTGALPGADPDGDGASNLAEFNAGTDPNGADTDVDGASDGQELANGTDPLAAPPIAGPGSASADQTTSEKLCGAAVSIPGDGARLLMAAALALLAGLGRRRRS